MLSYSNLTAISVRLQWSAVVPVTNYIVEYRPSTQPSWSDARRLPPTITTTSQLQGLEAEEEYVARVIILNNCDQQVTPEVTFTTDSEFGRHLLIVHIIKGTNCNQNAEDIDCWHLFCLYKLPHTHVANEVLDLA